MSEKKSWRVKYFGWITAQRVIAIVAVLGLVISLLGFSGVKMEDINRSISSIVAPGADHRLPNLDKPRMLTLSYPLETPLEYYYKFEINTRETFYSSENVQFSVTIENLGKKPAQTPLLRIFVVDTLGQIRSEWSGGLSKEVTTFDYKLPPPDQLTQGDWKIIGLLYDGDIMIAYTTREFYLSGRSTTETMLIPMIAFAAIMLTIVTTYWRQLRRTKTASAQQTK